MKRILFLSAFCLLLSGCGGGSGGTTTSSTSTATTPSTTSTTTTDTTVSKEITGTASEGAALTGKAYLKDAKGTEVTADIATDGKFKFVVDGLTTPYLLKAGNLYSFAPTHGTANINPFTDLATKIALNVTDLSTVYSNSTGTLATQFQTLQSNIQATVDDLNTKISQVYQKYGLTTADQKNFMTGTITIGQGVDALFDTFKVTVASDGSISMKTISDGVTIFTAKSSGNGTMTIVSENFSTNLPSALAGSTTASISMNMDQTLSDQAQNTTIAFSAMAMMTGNLGSQSFFPPGKIADYTGFQYLRDNDPDNMGHNTSFLTRVAENVMYILNDAQMVQLAALAKSQSADFSSYGAKRFPLMKAFRRLMEGDIPSSTTGLSLTALKAASKALYLIDGQVSYDRAVLYASVLNSLTTAQKASLASMKGNGWKSWPDTSVDPIKSAVEAKKTALGKDVDMVAIMTYASDLYSWYNGSLEADVYFCPERHGTYFGSFFMKDAPAIGHEGYSIDEQLTATAGRALSDSTYGYVDSTQATLMSSLVNTQRSNLYSGSTNIVSIRTQIATLLRSLLTTADTSGSVKAQVLALSGTYGELDGENNYNYATVMSNVYKTLTTAQKTKLMALRASIMAGKYTDGTTFDFTTTATPYLYSAVISDATASGYVGSTDSLFQ